MISSLRIQPTLRDATTIAATSPCSWQVFWCVFSFVGRKQEPGGSWSKGNSCSGASAKLRRPWFSFCAAVSLTLLTTKGKNSPPPPPPPPKKKPTATQGTPPSLFVSAQNDCHFAGKAWHREMSAAISLAKLTD